MSRRIYRGADKIVSVSKCKNWFCLLLNCESIIFILNIYVLDLRRAVSKWKQVDTYSIYPSWVKWYFHNKFFFLFTGCMAWWRCLVESSRWFQWLGSHPMKMCMIKKIWTSNVEWNFESNVCDCPSESYLCD